MSTLTGRLSGLVFLVCLLIFTWLLQGCQTYTPQVIEFCGTYHLHTNDIALDAAYRNRGGNKDIINAFYHTPKDAIHAMKWDFCGLGHEVYHGLKENGLIVEDGFEHFN